MPGGVVYGGTANSGGFVPSTGITYRAEHLNTYVFPDCLGDVAIERALSQIRDAERSGPILSTNCVLKLTRDVLYIINADNAMPLETVSLVDIRSVRAVMSHSSADVYRNLFAFASANTKQSLDVYIFQIHQISAEEVIQNMRKALGSLARHEESSRASSQQHPQLDIYKGPEIDAIVDTDDSEHGGVSPSFLSQSQQPEKPYHKTKQLPSSFGKQRNDWDYAANDENATSKILPSSPNATRRMRREAWSPSMNLPEQRTKTAAETKQEYLVLNYCFDDIEEFVDRLRRCEHMLSDYGADAAFWLNYPGGSAPNATEDHQRHQVVPPPLAEFIDVTKKVKLAIMLLARLDGHLRDPPADEVLHGLFGHLKLLARLSLACSIYRQQCGQGIAPASLVVSPLLSRRAIEFLNHNLSPAEVQLWESLGDAWQMPRDQWMRPVEPFSPIFRNGKQPNPTWINQL